MGATGGTVSKPKLFTRESGTPSAYRVLFIKVAGLELDYD